jgi:hypothetical protein
MKKGGQLHLSVKYDKYFTRYGSVCVLETKTGNEEFKPSQHLRN